MTNPGILFAFLALIGWGFGDFLIQKTVRVISSWKTLFWITLLGAIVLLPFVFHDIPAVWNSKRDLLLLVGISTVILVASLFDFEAMKAGKLAIVDPLVGLELPITVQFSALLLGEQLLPEQTTLIFLIFLGILLTITVRFSKLHYHKRILEKGVVLAGIAAVGMAAVNVSLGFTSRVYSPLVALWFGHAGVAAMLGIYAWADGELGALWKTLRQHPVLIVSMSIFDNGAWLSYMYAVLTIPIGVAIGISESYIGIAVLLGLVVNREKIRWHQAIGVVLVLLAVVALALITP